MQPRMYLEFEVAPTGEWIDLAIDYTGKERRPIGISSRGWNPRHGSRRER
jgi:hypothetical protein